MGRKGKRPPTRQSPAFSVAEWVSLNEAFARAMAALGHRDLAARDLYGHMRSGRLPSAARRVTRGGEETFERFDPSFWEGLTLVAAREPTSVLVSDSGANLLDGFVSGHFFVARQDFDRLYAVSGEDGGGVSGETPRPRRKPGPPPIDDWPLVVAAEWIRRVKAGEKDLTIAKMIEHCEQAMGYSPGLKEMGLLLNKLRSGGV